MENIQIKSTSILQAATSQALESTKLHLTANDHRYLFAGPIQRGLIFTKPKSSESNFFGETEYLIQHLKTSLSRTLDFFYPLAGRLATHQHDDNTVCFFIDCNNAGAQFVHAIAENVAISDIVEPTYLPPILHSLFSLNGTRNYEGVSNPLLAVQFTELIDGIFIGITINHAVADGSPFWHFINSWSEISRGSDHISQSPVFESWFRSETCLPISFPPGSINKPTNTQFVPPPLKERVFHFTKEKIAGMKARANTEAGVEKISHLQSLLAHVWKWVTRSRQLEPDQVTYLCLTFNLRSRLQPPVAELYFGNAIKGNAVALKTSALLENGIGHAALETNKMIASYTKDTLKKGVESEKNASNQTAASFNTTIAVVVSSSPRFDVYGNDFGWGRPIGVRSGPANKFDGLVTVYEGLEEGSIDIEVCTSPQVLQAMGNDSEFMEFVAS